MTHETFFESIYTSYPLKFPLPDLLDPKFFVNCNLSKFSLLDFSSNNGNSTQNKILSDNIHQILKCEPSDENTSNSFFDKYFSVVIPINAQCRQYYKLKSRYRHQNTRYFRQAVIQRVRKHAAIGLNH